MRARLASALGVAAVALFAWAKPGAATDLSKDVSAAAEMLQRLDSVAPVANPAPGQPAAAPAAPPKAQAPRGLSITTLQPRAAQPRTGILSQSSSTSSTNLSAPVPAANPAAPSVAQPSRQVYTLQPQGPGPDAPPANIPAGAAPPSTIETPPAQPAPAQELDETTTETLRPYRSVPPRLRADPARTFSVALRTSAPQRLEGNLGVSVIQAGFHGRQLWAAADVVNSGRTPCTRIELTFSIQGGGHQHVRIPALRPGQHRSIKVRLRIPRGNHPDVMQVTSSGPLTNFATAGHEASVK